MSTPNQGAAWIPPAPAEIQTTARKIKFLTSGVMPPPNVFIDQDDILEISTFTRTTGMIVTVRVRELMPDNTIQTTEQQIVTTAGLFPQTTQIMLAEGFLLSIEIIGDQFFTIWGNLFASANIIRGKSTLDNASETLCRGFATYVQPLSFPYGGIRNPTEGQGNIRSITGTVPGVGLEITEVVPPGVRWRIQSFSFVFTASAAVANRIITIKIDDGTNYFFLNSAAFSITANQVAFLTFAACGFQSSGILSGGLMAAPSNLILTAGWRIKTTTTALQAGDQYSGIQYCVEEWFG